MAEDNTLIEVSEAAAQVTIDIKAAEDAAKAYDFQGRDLMIHIDMDFGIPTPMNFVVLDPVLFGTSAFVEVLDVATAEEGQDFTTVDGFGEQTFDKVLTPEANKFIIDEVVKKTLAPSNFSYQGLGVFSFPVRIANKMRVTLLIRDPVPAFYERLHVLTQEILQTNITTKSSKKGL
jgi:hypothetical protein